MGRYGESRDAQDAAANEWVGYKPKGHEQRVAATQADKFGVICRCRLTGRTRKTETLVGDDEGGILVFLCCPPSLEVTLKTSA